MLCHFVYFFPLCLFPFFVVVVAVVAVGVSLFFELALKFLDSPSSPAIIPQSNFFFMGNEMSEIKNLRK
jgi:hypothetical protein